MSALQQAAPERKYKELSSLQFLASGRIIQEKVIFLAQTFFTVIALHVP